MGAAIGCPLGAAKQPRAASLMRARRGSASVSLRVFEAARADMKCLRSLRRSIRASSVGRGSFGSFDSDAYQPTVNGDPLSCDHDDEGRCLETNPCQRGQQCLAEDEPRAGSSPIYVDWSG